MLRVTWLAARHARQAQGWSTVCRLAADTQAGSPAALAACQVPFDGYDARRPFAAAAEPAEQRVPLPAQVYGIEGKYAGALYIAGVKNKALEQIENDLIEVWNAAAKNAEFRNFLKDPSIPKKAKAESLEEILQGLKVSELTRRFFGVLAENNRLAEIVRISNTFDDLLAAARGEVTATVTTAAELGKKDLDEVKSGLTQVLEKGQKLIVQEKVDPTIIGGIIIDVGDKHIDLSISSRVKRIQQLIMETI